MNRLLLNSVPVAVLAILGGTGCVSTGKYKTLEMKYQDIQAGLVRTGAVNEDLKKSKQALEDDRAALLEEKATLLEERRRLAEDKENLEKVNAELVKAQRDAKAQYRDMLGQLEKEVGDGQLRITQYRNMLSVDVTEKAFFISGSAELKPTGQEVLKKIGVAINKHPDKYVRVVGHTDNVPIRNSTFADNWQLAAARAAAAVRFLQKHGRVAGKRLEVSGRGEFDPVANNGTTEGRQQNRRIEILLIDKALFESTHPSSQAVLTEKSPATPTP